MPRATRVALLGAALVAVAVGVGVRYAAPSEQRSVPAAPSTLAPAAPRDAGSVLSDPVSPDRPVSLDDVPRVDAGTWTTTRPAFQYSHAATERGGVEPCAVGEGDTSAFEAWSSLGRGHFSAPRELRLAEGGRFNLVIHLNGDGPVRRELVASGQPFVLYTLTLDPSESYAPLFTGAAVLAAITAGVEQGMSKRAGGASAHVAHLALSAWSAGFVGIEAALAQPSVKDIDAVILIDGLHAPRHDELAFKAQLQPFLAYAQRAVAGEKFLLVSHSSIDPPDFASTTECAHYLISALGGSPQPVRRADPFGLELVEYFSRGNFHVRGYAGNDKADHCAQLAVLRAAYAALGRRWGSGSAK